MTAPAGIFTVQCIFVAESAVTLVAASEVLPVLLKKTFAPFLKPVPERLVTATSVPRLPDTGLIPVTAGGNAVTVIYPVLTVVLLPPALVALSDTL
jgi:hypothetical protein